MSKSLQMLVFLLTYVKTYEDIKIEAYLGGTQPGLIRQSLN